MAGPETAHEGRRVGKKGKNEKRKSRNNKFKR